MRKSPRLIFWIIILLGFIALFINLPPSFKYNRKPFFSKLHFNKELAFREGLDLKREELV